MKIQVKGAKEHNLKNIDIEIGSGLTVVTGVSGSGKTSLVFDTLFHEARRRFQDVFAFGSPGSRLAPAKVDSITGMGPAVAVGQNLLNRNPLSTLASASGLHPFLRLLYARFGSRHCRVCDSGLSLSSEDEIVDQIAAFSENAPVDIYAPILRQSQGSHSTLLHMLEQEFGAEAILINGTPWDHSRLLPDNRYDIDIHTARIHKQTEKGRSLNECRQAIQTVKALGANAVILRFPNAEKEELIFSFAPVCVQCGTWFRDLEPKHFHQSCSFCGGKGCSICKETGLHPEAASVTWKGLRFPDLLGKSIDEVRKIFETPGLPASAHRLIEEITKRIEALEKVGLAYVTLERPVPSLSRGESQRVRLAVALVSRLEDILHILDEPTIGQHPADVLRLIPTFKELAGPVVFVEHDRIAAAYADHAIDIGPGAGSQGGKIIFTGTPQELWNADTPTGKYFSLRERVRVPEPRPPAKDFLSIKGACAHNLRDIEVKIPHKRLTVITGVSGSGKSTLVEEVLVASLDQGIPVGCTGLEGPRLKPMMVDQSPIGKNPRSTPATYTNLSDLIRDLFSAKTGLSASHFSFNRPEGACPTCSGMGAVEIKMKYLPSSWVPCPDCGGLRFQDDVLDAKVKFGDHGLSIADFYELSAAEAFDLLEKEKPSSPIAHDASQILETFINTGLDYLPLGQPSPTLSGGEAQRVKLAKYLGKKKLSDRLIVLDEPSTGLHPQDLKGLIGVLDHLVKAGATIVVVEHNTDIIRAADWIIDLGPGAGSLGGMVIYMGPLEENAIESCLRRPGALFEKTAPGPRKNFWLKGSPSPMGILECEDSLTGLALREENAIKPLSPTDTAKKSFQSSPFIQVRGGRANNLKDVDVDFPKGTLTVVTGVSGSGKSSLVVDVLEAEARRRFLETLSLYERQGLKEGPQAPVDSVSGLGVCLTVTPDRKMYDQRSTVGTVTEIWQHLAVLLSTIGERTCLTCGEQMTRGEEWKCPGCGASAPIASPPKFSPFNYAAACTTCQGIGTLQAPKPEKLIRNPGLPLCGGAMYSPGFFPKGYLCKPGNGGYDMVRAFAGRYGFDPDWTPWNKIPPEVRERFLFGDPEPLEVIFRNPRGQSHMSVVKFPGFYGWIRDWDVGGTYTDLVECPGCRGARLRPQYLAVTLNGYNIHQLSEQPLSRLREVFYQKLFWGVKGGDFLEKSPPTIIRKRLHFLEQVGLGYLHLNRVTATLSAGEAQRVKLAGLLGSGLTSLTVLLDEPSRGLHPNEVKALVGVMKELRDEGNTIIVVEHDPGIIREADHLIDVGPLAGAAGGMISAQGTPAEVAKKDTITGAWLRGERRADLKRTRREPKGWMVIEGARENNLKDEIVRIPRGVLVGVCGVSGSGKSTLMIDTIGRALAPRKHTTSVAREPLEPGKHDHIIDAPAKTLVVDQTRKGIQSPGAFLEIFDPLIALYAESEDANALGLDENTFKKKCSACLGTGLIREEMGFLPDLYSECETCEGSGYTPEVREVKLHGYSLPQLNRLTIDEVYEIFQDLPSATRNLFEKRFLDFQKLLTNFIVAQDVGLGYLVLKQPGISLSGGEAQRLKIAKELCKKTAGETLYILDEPTVGQHLEDVDRLCGILHRLVEEGNSVIVVEHHPMLLASCDWLLEMGPGAGSEGGRIIASGTPENLADMNTPTAPFLREVLKEKP